MKPFKCYADPSKEHNQPICDNPQPNFWPDNARYTCPKPTILHETTHDLGHIERICLNPWPVNNGTGTDACENYEMPDSNFLINRGFPYCLDRIKEIIENAKAEDADKPYKDTLDGLEVNGCIAQLFLSSMGGGFQCPPIGIPQNATCPYPFAITDDDDCVAAY